MTCKTIMQKQPTYSEHLSEPWFSLISLWLKIVETEGLDKCLPGVPSIDHGLSVYFKYYTKADEAAYGVVSIKFELLERD